MAAISYRARGLYKMPVDRPPGSSSACGGATAGADVHYLGIRKALLSPTLKFID